MPDGPCVVRQIDEVGVFSLKQGGSLPRLSGVRTDCFLRAVCESNGNRESFAFGLLQIDKKASEPNLVVDYAPWSAFLMVAWWVWARQ